MGKKEPKLTPSAQVAELEKLAPELAKQVEQIPPEQIQQLVEELQKQADALAKLPPEKQADLLAGKPISEITLTKSQDKLKEIYRQIEDKAVADLENVKKLEEKPTQKRDSPSIPILSEKHAQQLQDICDQTKKLTAKIKDNEHVKDAKKKVDDGIKYGWEHVGECQDKICEWPGPVRTTLEGVLGNTIYEEVMDDPMGGLLPEPDPHCKLDQPALNRMKEIWDNETLNKLPIIKEDKTNWRLYDWILGPTLDNSYNMYLDTLKSVKNNEPFGNYDVHHTPTPEELAALEPAKKQDYYGCYYCYKKKKGEEDEDEIVDAKELKRREKEAKKRAKKGLPPCEYCDKKKKKS